MKKNAFNLKYSKLEKYPIKSYRNINYKNLNEDNTEDDINITYKDKNEDKINNINDNGNSSYEKSQLLNINKKSFKDISNDNNILNNNSNKIISETKKDNTNKEVSKYNPIKQINKSKSYFGENNNVNKNNNNNYIYLNDVNDKINNFSHNSNNNNNNTKDYNYKKNVNYFNQKKRILKGNNKNSFKHKIIYDLENQDKKELSNNFSDNSFESININDFINKVNYKGDKKDFPKYMEELRLKADITNIVQNMFKNEINSYDGLDKLLEDYSKQKYKKILNMYKFLLDKLIQINHNKINDKEINSFYEEIYSFK